MQDEEVWWQIPIAPGYELSSEFRVRSKRKIMAVYLAAKGRLSFRTMINGKRGTAYLSRAIASVIYGEIPSGMHVCHSDDNRTNNFPSNLYVGTPKQNAADSSKNERRVSRKLSNQKVKEAKSMIASGTRSLASIARELNVTPGLISQIKHGRTHSNIS